MADTAVMIQDLLDTFRSKLDDISGSITGQQKDYTYNDSLLTLKVGQAVWEIESRWNNGYLLLDQDGAVCAPSTCEKITPAFDYSLKATFIYINAISDILFILCPKIIPNYTFDNRNIQGEGAQRVAPKWITENMASLHITQIVDLWKNVSDTDNGVSWTQTSGVLNLDGISDGLNLDRVAILRNYDLQYQIVNF